MTSVAIGVRTCSCGSTAVRYPGSGQCMRCYHREWQRRRSDYDARIRLREPDTDDVLRVVVRPLAPLTKPRERGQIILVTERGVTTAWERVDD